MGTYCDDKDLLGTDISFGTDTRRLFISIAEDEMNKLLGFRYVLPLGPTPLSAHVTVLLKNICVKIASGRMILDRAASGEDNGLHAYGLSLLQEGLAELMSIYNGNLDLIGVVVVPSTATEGTGPALQQGDTYSGVDAYYDWLSNPNQYAPGTTIWKPGIYAG